ncbi:MAG: glycosyltransferase family 4 protein [Nitrospirota bacterium]
MDELTGHRMERPLTVCFISPLGYGMYRPESRVPFGGAEVQLYLLAQTLSRDRQFQIVVLTTVDEEPKTERLGAVTLVTRRGLRRLEGSLWRHPFRTLRAYGSAFRDMLRQLRAVDADVYLHAGAGVEVGAYAVICRFLRRKFVLFVASSADLCEPYGKVTGPLRWLYPLGLRLADSVVCRTEEQKGWLKAKYGRAGVLIRTGCPSPLLRHSSPVTRHSVLWVGRFHPLKQPHFFLDLAQRLPCERFIMVATQDRSHQGLRESVLARARHLPNLAIHEDVPWAEVDRFFARAKLLVNTSTYEGFPNTFVQAAMHAVPILSLNVDPDGVLTRHGIGVCAAGSFDRLAGETESLCSSPERLAELGRRAVDHARTHHDLNRTAEALKGLIGDLTGRLARPGLVCGEPAVGQAGEFPWR